MLRFPSAAVIALALAGLLLGASAQRSSTPSPVPTRLVDEGYVGSEACRACHADNHTSWFASYHRTMTQEAKRGAVLARFEGLTPDFEGVAWKLWTEGDAHYARAVGPDGGFVSKTVRVVMTTGSHNYQLYWFEAEGAGQLELLPLVWHVGERRWVPRHSVFLAPKQDAMFVDGGRWPRTCIQCHTTNGTPDHESDGRPHVAEFGISCEACHGPGAAHVALQTERKVLEKQGRTDFPEDTTIVDPGSLPHDRASQVCGQCHAIHPLTKEAREVWKKHGYAYRPGDDLSATRDLLRGVHERNTPAIQAFLDRNPGTLEGSYWSDGEVRVSGREYNGIVETPCYQRGELSCLSCHEMHASGDAHALSRWADDQLRPTMDTSRACTQCHAEYTSPEKLREHTHHAPASSGSECMNCHMPHTTYGLTKAIRSHTITSPSVATALATGRPDACSLCHLDKPLGWTADHLREWYGHERPELDAEREQVSAAVLWGLSGDAGQRALVAWSLGWGPARATSGSGWMPYLLSTLMQDPFDAVRFVAMRSARADPRHAGFAIDFTRPIEEQRHGVRAGYLKDWQTTGLVATPEQRAAVLIGPDGKLDVARFQQIFGRVDKRVMVLAE